MMEAHLNWRPLLQKPILCLAVLLALPSALWTADKRTPAEQTARYFDAIRAGPVPLLGFLQKMPKGGYLHNHLSGAVYAETFIQFAVADGLCFDRSKGKLSNPPCDKNKGLPAAEEAYKDGVLFGDMVDAFSMRDFHPHCDFVGDAANFTTRCESGHDHFFATFGNFGAASYKYTPAMIAEVVRRAAAQNESYLELMFGLDGGESTTSVGDMVAARWEQPHDVKQVPDLARNL